jgi:acetoin utilization deacetylase AcuC-like enzyme
MLCFTSDHFVLPLPAGHRFPMRKYALLRARVQAELPQVRLREAPAASDGELALAHRPDYIARVCEGRLSAAEQREIGFPWSPAMVERARRSVGATIAACRAALAEGVAAQLAGGTHHAYADRGSGFCVFNDAAVATRLLQAEAARTRRRLRVAIVDLDVHQGNGTAAILGRDDDVFTLSLHGEKNFPFRKVPGHLDVALPDACDDQRYLDALDAALDELERRFAFDLIIYLAGADPYAGDRLGRMALTMEGLAERDRRVLRMAQRRGAAVAVTMAGGYAEPIEHTVAIKAATVRAAAEAHGLRMPGEVESRPASADRGAA